MIDLNLMGVLVLDTARAFLPGLLLATDAGRPADLVIVSSLGARVYWTGFVVCSASKAAVSALAAGLRAEFGSRGLRVTNVEPGPQTLNSEKQLDTMNHRQFSPSRRSSSRHGTAQSSVDSVGVEHQAAVAS
jgi:NAD(P)-dependent dehydrogenase (short-subunit alcohol dehydrogenase family)